MNDQRPAPTPDRDVPATPEPARGSTDVVDGEDAGSPSTDQFESVDASVVPVPIESLNRLVLAVDELGSEMTQVRQAIRELTATLSESQASFARLLAGQAAAFGPPPPDPLASVTGPYVAGAPSPTPFTAPPTVETPTDFDPATLGSSPSAEPDAVPAPTFAFPDPVSAPTVAPSAEPAGGLGDLPIVSTGDVQVMIGPIGSLDELDDAVDHIRRINGVQDVSVTSFEGSNVVLTTQLARPLPLASLLRSDLGRDVASCRSVDGRIVVEFGAAGRGA